MIDTLGAGDTFNAAAIYYMNKSKVEFMRKYKKEATCTNIDQTKDDISVNGTTVKRDIKDNSDIKNLDQAKFINEMILQKAIKFACCIAGAKVGLRGYDCLNVISSDILQLNFLEH